MIRKPTEIRDAYRDSQVAAEYVDRRFIEPIGALLHARQRDHLKRLVQRTSPASVLEIAPGPARLTIDLAHLQGIAIDASAEMLQEAKRRLAAAGVHRWRFVQGDVFGLPFRPIFDLVYAFRLIRHFDRTARGLLYQEIATVLRPGGWLVFDAVNERVSMPLRRAAAPGEYEHFDALFEADALRAELTAHGFVDVLLTGVQRRYPVLRMIQVLVAPRSRSVARAAMEIVDRSGGEPLEWIVTCRRA